ncbi:MAG: class IV adenylate cyclase [Candidatus Woesearchaeota archaeon]
MKEVEILFSVANTKKECIIALKKFRLQRRVRIRDTYYMHPQLKQFDPRNGRLSEVFRIREKDKRIILTHKKDYYQGKEWTYADEEELHVHDLKQAQRLVAALGFKPLIVIDNVRTAYLTSKYEIVLEEVKGLGLFLEIERLRVKDSEDINQIKQEIRKFSKPFGLQLKESNEGKPSLMLKKMKKK